jgi:hypothetical protein
MITLLLGPAMGLSPDLALSLSLVEGVACTVLVSLLAERYLFPMPQD